MSQIREFKRTEPFHIISRAFAQSNQLSYEAKGLLTELTSHSESYKIYKTQLYKKNSKNSRHKIEKIWRELEEEGYLLSFKKRDKKKYAYEYMFSTEPFSQEEIIDICQKYELSGYELHTKLTQENDENFGVLKYDSPKNSVKSTKFGVLNFNSPKSTVENQNLINNNLINNNLIDIYESYDSGDELSTTNKERFLERKQYKETLEEVNSQIITSKYSRVLPEKVLSMILSLVGNDLEMCEQLLQNILKSKSSLENREYYPIMFEEMSENQIDALCMKIKYVCRRLNNEQLIAQYGEIKNKGAFCFSTLKNFFEQEIAVVKQEYRISDDIADILMTKI